MQRRREVMQRRREVMQKKEGMVLGGGYLKEVVHGLLSDTTQGEVLQGPEAEEGGRGHTTLTELSYHTSLLLDMLVKMEGKIFNEN